MTPSRTLALVAALSTSACSLVYVHGPGSVTDPPTTYAPCTDDTVYPWVDALVAVLYSGLAIAAITDSSSTTHTSEGVGIFIIPVGFAASAIYGFSAQGSCRTHHLAWAKAHPEAPNGPVPYAPYGYPPPGYGYPPPQPYAPQQPYPPQQPPPQQGPAAGAEGGACIAPSNTCNAGLTCASDLCVRAP